MYMEILRFRKRSPKRRSQDLAALTAVVPITGTTATIRAMEYHCMPHSQNHRHLDSMAC